MKRLLVFFVFLIPLQLSAQIITTIAGTDTVGYSGDGGPAIEAKMDNPHSVRFDKMGNIYIPDWNNNVIRKIDTSGIITTIAGNGTPGYSGDGGPAIDAQLNLPTDVAIGPNASIYITDGQNNVIRKINSLGVITTIAGTGVAGFSGDGGPAINAKLYEPYSIILDDTGNIYFADADNLRVRKIDTFGIITTLAGGGSNLGDGGLSTNAKIVYPGYIAISALGELYIPDWTHHRVRKVDKNGIITTVAGNGTLGNTGDGGLATDAELNAPNAISIDKAGNLYISDAFANVIRKISNVGIISTIAGNGTKGYSGNGAPAIDARFDAPDAIIGPDGNMYIADANNNVIRKVTFSTDVNSITKSKPTISIYPNPSINEVNISSSDKAIKTIQIINTLGQTLFSHTYNTNEITLDISALPKGFYVIKINNEYNNRLVKI